MLSFMVEGQPLKDWISTLLNQEPNRRLNIFEKIEGYQVDDRQVRELRANPLTVRAEEELVEPIRPVEENWQHNGIVHPVNTRPHVPVVVAGEVPKYGWGKPNNHPPAHTSSFPPTSTIPSYPVPNLTVPPGLGLRPTAALSHPSFPATTPQSYPSYQPHPLSIGREPNPLPPSTFTPPEPIVLPKLDFLSSGPVFNPSQPLPSYNPPSFDPIKPKNQSMSLHLRSPSTTSEPGPK